jgi:hypothetical protein
MQRQNVPSGIRREKGPARCGQVESGGQDDKMKGPYVFRVRLSHRFSSNCASFQLCRSMRDGACAGMGMKVFYVARVMER